MLLNLSNHPSNSWSDIQIAEANKHFGQVVDIPFPHVDPNGDEHYICSLADLYFDICTEKLSNFPDENCAVHVMGELNFTFLLVSKLRNAGIKCIASTTERNAIEKNGLKISEFKFVRFREYTLC
jgi:hypothetical protein